jgi:hypothetical protein
MNSGKAVGQTRRKVDHAHPTSTHFLPLRRTIRADKSGGQRISVGGTTTYAKNTTMIKHLKMMHLQRKSKEI